MSAPFSSRLFDKKANEKAVIIFGDSYAGNIAVIQYDIDGRYNKKKYSEMFKRRQNANFYGTALYEKKISELRLPVSSPMFTVFRQNRSHPADIILIIGHNDLHIEYFTNYRIPMASTSRVEAINILFNNVFMANYISLVSKIKQVSHIDSKIFVVGVLPFFVEDLKTLEPKIREGYNAFVELKNSTTSDESKKLVTYEEWVDTISPAELAVIFNMDAFNSRRVILNESLKRGLSSKDSRISFLDFESDVKNHKLFNKSDGHIDSSRFLKLLTVIPSVNNLVNMGELDAWLQSDAKKKGFN